MGKIKDEYYHLLHNDEWELSTLLQDNEMITDKLMLETITEYVGNLYNHGLVNSETIKLYELRAIHLYLLQLLHYERTQQGDKTDEQ